MVVYLDERSGFARIVALLCAADPELLMIDVVDTQETNIVLHVELSTQA
jgi:hypothetical protein